MLTMERPRDAEARAFERNYAQVMSERRGSYEESSSDAVYTLTRKMETNEDEQLDVDITIMDFLTYRAIDSVFEWRASPNPHSSDLPSALATMTAEWRSLLSHKHAGRRLNTQAALRSRLLQFVLLFTHRFNHDQTWTTPESLAELRTQNRKRGAFWREHTTHAPASGVSFDAHSEFPLSERVLIQGRSELASSLGQPRDRRRWVTDLEGTPSLHCLLSVFVDLCAARVDLGDWIPSHGLLELLGQFMLQAVIEEYLLNGAFGEQTFDTIFAYGCPGTDRRPDDGPFVPAMRTLFCAEGNTRQEIAGWAAIKQKCIDALLPLDDDQASLSETLRQAQRENPYTDFEATMLRCLQYLHRGLVKPDLIQVEEGRISIDGTEFSERDSQSMIRRMAL